LGHSDPQKIQLIKDQVAVIDARLTPLEDEFSETLGKGARWINGLLAFVAFVATAMLLFTGIVLSGAVLKQIRQSDEKYRNLINTANDAILVIDAETRRILEANNKACEVLGIPDHELLGGYWKSKYVRLRKWKRCGAWPAGSLMTSTIC
jgi:PAS domain-containing protein